MPACCARRPLRRTSTSTQALTSLQRFAERRPTGLALAHYGLLDDPLEVLDEADGTLRKWADVAESAFQRGEDIAAALSAEFASDLDGVAEEHREKLEVMNGVHSNAAGLAPVVVHPARRDRRRGRQGFLSRPGSAPVSG